AVIFSGWSSPSR
ncbi:hypothetical protein EC890511_2120, partial [Escherichia coli 89.0511]